MKLVLSEEEQFLKDTAKNFAEERSPISHFRSLRDNNCLLYTSPSPRDRTRARMPSSA